MENRLLNIGDKLFIPLLSDMMGFSSYFFIVREIIEGGMGICAKILSSQGDAFALKMIHGGKYVEFTSRERYYEEMKTWLTLSAFSGVSEAICAVKINDIPCIISRWMSNGDLTSFIYQKPIPLQFYASIDRIIQTLDWVYQKYHIIHRDLKPQNILVDEDLQVYISDWGLSKELQLNAEKGISIIEASQKRQSLVETDGIVGTVTYASPEQLRGLRNIDFRSDIYSLGCIMYQWETGKLPFIGQSWEEIASGHVFGAVPCLNDGAQSNFKIGRIISKCLEKDPAQRYQSYTELRQDILSVAKQLCGYEGNVIGERRRIIRYGNSSQEEFIKQYGIKGKSINGITAYLLKQEDINPFIDEAIALSALGEHNKAIKIYQSLFDKDLFEGSPDSGFVQLIANNYSKTLVDSGRFEEAYCVLKTISKARNLPSAYYVNMTNVLNYLKRFSDSEDLAKTGIDKYSNDPDIWGNLTISLIGQEKYQEACNTASERLKLSRDVHSLSEAGLAAFLYGRRKSSVDFPYAMKYYKASLIYDREAEKLNPRYFTAKLNISNTYFILRRFSESSDIAINITNSSADKGTFQRAVELLVRNMIWTSNFETAIAECNKWLKSFPDSTELKRLRAQAITDGRVIYHYEDGKPVIDPDVVSFFEECLNNDSLLTSDDLEYLAKTYSWFEDLHHKQKGLTLFEWGLTRFPNNWQFPFWLSVFLNHYGQCGNAIKVAEKAVKQFPWEEKLHHTLGSVYKRVGMEKEAEYEFSEEKRIVEEKKRLYESAKTW